MALEINTTIIINASSEKVWSVLTNFEEYPQWNPFIRSIKGSLQKGSKLNISIDTMKFTPTILVLESNKKLQWLGRLWFPGVFDGKHSFELVDHGDRTTTLYHSESFQGILVPFLKKKLLKETKQGFIAMNIALKNKVESTED